MKQYTVLLLALALTACANDIFRDGKNGAKGAKGDKGDAGSSCSVMNLTDGTGAVISCQDGTSVFIANGSKGDKGDKGDTGADAIPVQMIQFCPNVIGGAPNFPEQGFKIGNKIYAVYSANGKASLAELYPGTYTTTAPGINCTFTIGVNGSVSN